MELTRHAYLRSLAAPPSALAGSAVRVKLVFMEELAAFVHRHRGFSACWFLIPPTARLVGDLLHEIAQEFELLARCPQGIELLLDGFHMLANQEIGMVRDNDTLAVHCVAFVGEKSVASTRRSSERGPSKRRREEEPTTGAEVPARETTKKSKSETSTGEEKTRKKTKTTDETNGDKKNSVVDAAPTNRKGQQLRVRPTVSAVTLNSSLSSDSSSSSDSSDENDDDEMVKPTPAKATKEAFRKVIKETVKSMKQDVSMLSKSTAESSSSDSGSSSSDSSDSSDDEAVPASKTLINGAKSTQSNGKQDAKSETRTRRRRRPRRRPKNGVGADKEATRMKPAGKQPKANGKVATTLSTTTPTDDTQPKEIRPLRIRGVPPPGAKSRGMNHVRFDAPPPETTPPNLEKYGPQASNAREKKHVPVEVPAQTEKQPEDEAVSREPMAKKPFKEMWKRPYEIISSIHDAQKDSTGKTNGKPTLDTLLSAFPVKPMDATRLPTVSGLQTDDIVAYKTLTLCMETFQPVVSDWQCGQVVDVIDDDRSVTLIPYTWVWPTKYGSGDKSNLQWKPTQPHAGEDACVSVNQDEISELRYVHGPTKTHLDSTKSS